MSNSRSTSSFRLRRGRPYTLLLFALIVAFGVWLRLDQITLQIVADDEWHALNYLIFKTYKDIFLHFGISDYCIPMTLLDKLVAKNIGLSELWMRALPLISGIAALIVLPIFVLKRFGRTTTILFAVLLAISPMLVYFSRYARPYAVIFVLGFVGVLAFERFLATGERRQGILYTVCAILTPWFHPVMLPLMLAPIGFALVRELPDRARLLARVRELWPYAVAIAVGLLLLVAPPVIEDYETLRARAGLAKYDGETFRIGFDLLSGSGHPSTGILFATALLLGLLCWLLRRRALLGYFAFLLVCQTGALLYARPDNAGAAIVPLRYTIPLLGFVLLLAAEGLTRIDWMLHRESRGWVPRHLPSTMACLAFVAWSPVLSPLDPENGCYFRPNAWTNHAIYQYQYSRADRQAFLENVLLPKHVSNFYTRLAQIPAGSDPSSQCIVEAPLCFPWHGSPYVVYQHLHRWPTLMGMLQPREPLLPGELPLPDARFRFRNFVGLADFDALRARGVAFVVLHKDLSTELQYPIADALPSVAPTIARYTARFGRPCFEDEDVVVFDVRSKL